MSCFSTQTATGKFEPDPSEHVNYTLGMVLGVDDFKQEFAYASGRNKWAVRDLIGYGTVRGLSVKVEFDAAENDWRLMVSPGVAVSPQGEKICVPTAQCCFLNSWLKANEEKVREKVISISSPLSSDMIVKVYVKLCYRECLTKDVLIPGEPCRSEDNLTQPSRVKDDFHLKLCLEPPKQIEEEAVRDFVDWLKGVKVTSEQGASTPLTDFLKAIRDAVDMSFSSPLSSPVSPPDFMLGNPPPSFHIHPDDACKYLRAAFRLWTTELRPRWIERWYGCGATALSKGANDKNDKTEECLLLAELQIPLLPGSPSGFIVNDVEEIEIIEDQRPFVLHLRALQEWLLCKVDEAGQTIFSPPSGGGVTDHGALIGLGDDDHTQYLLANGTRALSGNLSAGGNRITNMGLGAAAGDAVPFQQALKQNDVAGGDLSGTYPNPTVEGLQGRPVTNVAPDANQVLTWSGTAWVPRAIDLLTLAIITPINTNTYDVWFNLDAVENRAEVSLSGNQILAVQAEDDAQPNFLRNISINVGPHPQPRRNLFRITFQPAQAQPPGGFYLRFNFFITEIDVKVLGSAGTQKLSDFATANNIRYAGFDGAKFVTVFVRSFFP